MREYAKASSRLWTGRLGKAIRGDQPTQLLAAYLVTCPHGNMIGLFHLPAAYVAADLGLGGRAIARAMGRLEALGFLRYDPEGERVWVVEAWRHELGKAEDLQSADNKRFAVADLLRGHLSSPLLAEFLDRYPGTRAAIGDLLDVPESPSEAPSEPLRRGSNEEREAPSRVRAPARAAHARAVPVPDPDPDPASGARATPSDFDAFWLAYGKKVGKADARKAWKQTAKERPPLAVLLERLAKLQASEQWQREGGRFHPHPATWLRRGGWDDEVAVASPAKVNGHHDDDPLSTLRDLARQQLLVADVSEDVVDEARVAIAGASTGRELHRRFFDLTGVHLNV